MDKLVVEGSILMPAVRSLSPLVLVMLLRRMRITRQNPAPFGRNIPQTPPSHNSTAFSQKLYHQQNTPHSDSYLSIISNTRHDGDYEGYSRATTSVGNRVQLPNILRFSTMINYMIISPVEW